jgi:hypothetical protein
LAAGIVLWLWGSSCAVPDSVAEERLEDELNALVVEANPSLAIGVPLAETVCGFILCAKPVAVA